MNDANRMGENPPLNVPQELLQSEIEALKAKIKRYEEREPLVKMLVEQVAADSPEYTTSTLEVTAKAVRDFKL